MSKNPKVEKFMLLSLIVVLALVGSYFIYHKGVDSATKKIDDSALMKNLRPSTLTMAGEKVTIIGDLLKEGSTVDMDYTLAQGADVIESVKTKDLSDYSGWKIIETVPSLDTPVCAMQTAQLNMSAPLYEDVNFIIVSQDLPFAINNYISNKGITNVDLLSDYKTRGFSSNNSLLIKETQLNARAILVLDENNVVQYIEYAADETDELDLTKALNVLDENGFKSE